MLLWMKVRTKPINYSSKLEGNLKSYKDLLEELQEIIEEVNDRTEEGCKKHYVPHHAVITPD